MSSSSNRPASTLGDGDGSTQPMTATDAVDELRRQVARRDRRRGRIAVWSAFGGVALLALGLFGFGYWATHNKPSYVVPKNVAVHSDGIVVGGKGPIRVDMYIDYQCANCKAFEMSTAAALNTAIATNRITLVYHPLALQDAAVNTPYATRAAASAACASDMGAFLAYNNRLFADEPLAAPPAKTATKPAPKPTPKVTPRNHGKTVVKPTPKAVVPAKPAAPAPTRPAGLTDDQLVQVGAAAGIINPDFARCLRAGTYDKWVANENSLAAAAHITTTPTVLVNGVSIAAIGARPTLAELTAAIG